MSNPRNQTKKTGSSIRAVLVIGGGGSLNARIQNTPRDIRFGLHLLFAGLSLGISLEPVVRSFLGDNDIVNMRLAQAGRSDADEFALLLKLPNGVTTRIAHARPEPAYKLRDHFSKCAFVRHATFNAFRH